MYTYEKRIRALQQYQEIGSIQKTIRALGYPGRQTLYRWIQEREQPQKEKSVNRGRNTPEHPRHPQLTRSMSKKGCSPDNSACEGFFGRMKNEMFYGLSWINVSIDDFIQRVNNYMKWYREKRIKVSLGGISLTEHRQNFGLHA